MNEDRGMKDGLIHPSSLCPLPSLKDDGNQEANTNITGAALSNLSDER
jgi:hypothetical protein